MISGTAPIEIWVNEKIPKPTIKAVKKKIAKNVRIYMNLLLNIVLWKHWKEIINTMLRDMDCRMPRRV